LLPVASPCGQQLNFSEEKNERELGNVF